MWIVRLALSRPYTFIVLALVILIVSPLVILRTPTDIFPEIRIPVVSVIWNYSGLPPKEMEQRIVSNYERAITTLVNDVEHIESQSLGGIAVVKIFFRPSVILPTALAQVTAISQTVLRGLPPGSTPPLVITYSASTVPVLQIGLGSRRYTEQELFDIGNNVIRTQLATVQGAALPFPYGGKQRLVSVDIDTSRLQARGLSALDVVNAVNAQNLIVPAGTAKMSTLEYAVEMNSSFQAVADINDLPVRTENGATIYLRDVAQVRDGYSPQTNIVRQNGLRGVLLSVYKTGSASTLDIVKQVRDVLPRISATVPDLDVRPLFDQSLFVRAAVDGVVREALIAACLTAVMILLFLGSWRSTLIIAISIPLSILTSICALSALGETINIMTLGGLALAVGILVDDATVTIESIERHLALGKELKQAILDGAHEIAIPAFVSTLCICIVFVPMFFLAGVAKYLFIPLAEAVVFAMLASYVLSRTLVPTLAMYLVRGHEGRDHEQARRGFAARFQRGFERRFEQFRTGYRDVLARCLRRPVLFAGVAFAFFAASALVSQVLGRDFFPEVDAGLIRLHLRARSGLRIEETARLADEVESVIRSTIPAADLDAIIDNLGLPYSGINLSYSNAGTIGSSDGEILIALKADRRSATRDLVGRLRPALAARFPGTQFYFQPADIVSQILNFGTPAPIDVRIVGRDARASYDAAQRIANRIRHVPGAVDVHVQQAFDAPALHLDVDRSRAQLVGLSQRDVAQNLLISLSSSFQSAPAFWLDPKNGVTYSVAVQTPQYRIDSLDALANTPVDAGPNTAPQILGNLATVSYATRPAVVSHYNVQPLVNVYASNAGRDLGAVAGEVRKIVDDARHGLPRGTTIEIAGQVATMDSSFNGLAAGLIGAIVLVYLLMVVNFQSWLDPFIIIMALPGALAGILWMLLLTRTTLNVPSLTGAIMCMGVATANSILLVSYARDRLHDGGNAFDAALEAGFVRIRPVLMTGLAMIIGMVPMALGLGEGGEQNAPLGRAVIGGLIFATGATLFVVPCVFTVLHRRRRTAHVEAPSGSPDGRDA